MTHTYSLVLNATGGAAQLVGIVLTGVDVRRKAAAWLQFIQPAQPTTDVRRLMVRQAAAAQGLVSYDQLQRINEPIAAALDAGLLLKAAILLIAGLVLTVLASCLAA